MIPAELLSTEYIAVIILFIVAVFILYRLFKLAVKSVLIMTAAFAFPFVMDYMGIPMPFPATIDIATRFAFLGLLLFSAYSFFGFIAYIGKIIIWPFRRKKR